MKISSKELAEELAGRLTDAMDMEVLAEFFYNHHVEYYTKTATAETLHEDAVNLGLLEEGETLEILD